MLLKSSNNTRAKFGDRFLEGVCLGLVFKTGDSVIGTPEGMVKAVRGRMRLTEGPCNCNAVVFTPGTQECPVPGRRSGHIPTDVNLKPRQDGIPEEDGGNASNPAAPGELVDKIPANVPDAVARPDDDIRQWHVTRLWTY